MTLEGQAGESVCPCFVNAEIFVPLPDGRGSEVLDLKRVNHR